MISVVIPVYRSANLLPQLYDRLAKVFRSNSTNFEVIFVEDCGGDASWDVIVGLVSAHTNVRGFQLSRNFGQHNALLCGIRACRGETVVTMDDDLQHPPEVLPELLATLDDRLDVVYGPPIREQHGILRNLSSRITKVALESSMGAANARQVSALRVFRTELRGAFSGYQGPAVNIDVLLTWGTTRFGAVKVRHDSRKSGESGYTPVMLIRHAMNMMTGYSVRPLKLASLMGFLFAVFGLCILAYVMGNWLLAGSTVPGFAFLASIVAIFSGVQLIAIGIIGEYLARMHLRTMERPAYHVRNLAGNHEENSG